jgi:SAM-dependent methyltransferase
MTDRRHHEPPAGALPSEFLAELDRLAASHLARSDPREQSGFGGGAERWRAEREPILEAIDRDGALLDVGCANGFLLESLCAWSAERGRRLLPFGVDRSAALVELARARLPAFRSNFWVGNAWDWAPPRRFAFVYTLADVVPRSHLANYLRRVLREFVEPGGRLIVGSYGSRSRLVPPLDLVQLLSSHGRVAGGVEAGDGVVRFAWVDASGG